MHACHLPLNGTHKRAFSKKMSLKTYRTFYFAISRQSSVKRFGRFSFPIALGRFLTGWRTLTQIFRTFATARHTTMPTLFPVLVLNKEIGQVRVGAYRWRSAGKQGVIVSQCCQIRGTYYLNERKFSLKNIQSNTCHEIVLENFKYYARFPILLVLIF